MNICFISSQCCTVVLDDVINQRKRGREPGKGENNRRRKRDLERGERMRKEDRETEYADWNEEVNQFYV